MNDDSSQTSGSDVAVSEVHPDGGRASVDVILETLASRRRRYALYYLQDQMTATLQEVALQVTAWENGWSVQAADFDDRIYADFYHRHLPKLADANMIEYDPRQELIRYDCSDLVERVLELARWMESPENDPD